MARSRWISDLHWVRTGRQSRSQKTQEALLEAAAALFAEKGVEATSVADVAARAGCSVGSVYHHFRDKPALFEAVLARMVRDLGKSAQRLSGQRVAQEGSPRRGFERFAAAMEAFLDGLCDPATYRILLVDGPAVLGRDRFDRIWIENSLVGLRKLLGRFDAGPGVPPELVDPLSRFMLGGVQEAALTIAHARRPAEARRSSVRPARSGSRSSASTSSTRRPTRPPPPTAGRSGHSKSSGRSTPTW